MTQDTLQDTPRFFLVTPRISDAESFAPRLAEALDACDVACLLIRPDTREPRAAQRIARALAGAAQARGVAALVPDDPQLALRAGADGCHVAGGDLEAALKALKPDRIVGAGPLATRDAAMSAGEAGVDYLMFGGPDESPEPGRTLELVAWWAQIFNVPCVGYAHGLEEVGPLVCAAAEFVALGEACFGDPRGGAAALCEAREALETAHRARIDANAR
ncbi:thiamine phosphate synthase [Methylocella sp.]|uniref:thiamine phosphate synthase n=1 Tax=Methylocella sp. TaxID=1978226 RepID=UPI0035B38188